MARTFFSHPASGPGTDTDVWFEAPGIRSARAFVARLGRDNAAWALVNTERFLTWGDGLDCTVDADGYVEEYQWHWLAKYRAPEKAVL